MEGNEDFKVLDDFDMEAFLAQNQNATTEKTEEKQESTPAAETTANRCRTKKKAKVVLSSYNF